MPKTLTLFTASYPAASDPLILEYLSFRDLNQFAEHKQEMDEILPQATEAVLFKANPQFINLKKEKAAGNFGALINHIKTRIMPMIGMKAIALKAEGETEEAYQELCGLIRGQLLPLIRNEFYSFKIQPKLAVQTVRDCLFHYCQYNADGAGQLLNQHIWKFWNSYTTDCLIEYGANVNIKFNDAVHSTLIQALRWKASAYTVQRLIEAGANYHDYQASCEGVPYRTMLVAAFYSHIDVLKIIVEKFPDEINATLQSLNTMLDDTSGVQYSCKFSDGRILLKGNETEKLYYEQHEILAAKAHLLIAISENQNRFLFTEKDRQDIVLYVMRRLEAAESFDDCLKIFDQHMQASYFQDSNAVCYSPEKIMFIELIQLRISEIFMENKSKKENRMSNSYHQEAQGLLSHAVFSSEHFQNGVSDRYISRFSGGLQRHAEDIQDLLARRRRFEERLHYTPNRNHVFQAASAAIHQANPQSLDCDENSQTMGMKKIL
jgi:hypothetical protein